MEFTNTITIERTVHDVFAFVADLENVPKWNYAIVETRKITDGPVAVGAVYRQMRSVPRRAEETLEIVKIDADRLFALHGNLGPFVGTLSYEFEEEAGATRLTNRADLEVNGVLKLAAPVLAARIRGAVATNLEVLKTLLEGD